MVLKSDTSDANAGNPNEASDGNTTGGPPATREDKNRKCHCITMLYMWLSYHMCVEIVARFTDRRAVPRQVGAN